MLSAVVTLIYYFRNASAMGADPFRPLTAGPPHMPWLATGDPTTLFSSLESGYCSAFGHRMGGIMAIPQGRNAASPPPFSFFSSSVVSRLPAYLRESDIKAYLFLLFRDIKSMQDIIKHGPLNPLPRRDDEITRLTPLLVAKSEASEAGIDA